MSKSITRAVLAHKQLIIAAIAIGSISAYAAPTASVAQLFGIQTPGASVELGEYGFVSVRTDRVSVDIDQDTIRIVTPGQDITIQRTGFQWWSLIR